MGLFESDLERIVSGMAKDIRKVPMNPKTTVVVNVDTVNGFFREGSLSSPRLETVIPEIVKVNEYFLSSRKLFLIDNHLPDSVEFKAFPRHCCDDFECSVIEELGSFAAGLNTDVIYKNSTNAFLSNSFIKWLAKNDGLYSNYVIVGAFTDICVMQFALTLRAYFNEKNEPRKRIAVVENAVQTFDSDSHNGDRMHTFALYNMLINGITLVRI